MIKLHVQWMVALVGVLAMYGSGGNAAASPDWSPMQQGAAPLFTRHSLVASAAHTDQAHPFWEANLFSGDERVTLSSRRAAFREMVEGDHTITWVYEHALPGGETCQVRVKKREDDGPGNLWTWAVAFAEDTTWRTDRVRFPMIPVQTNEVDVYWPRTVGTREQAPLTEDLHSGYPSQSATMQLAMFARAGQLLYVATEDPEAISKRFHLRGGREQIPFLFDIEHLPPGYGETSDWVLPYPVRIVEQPGDWYDGCMIYRSWALRHAPWCQAGPLTERADRPHWLAETPMWTHLGWSDHYSNRLYKTPSQQIYEALVNLRYFLDAPVGYIEFSWGNRRMGNWREPDVFMLDADPLGAMVSSFARHDIHYIPYTNPRLWDIATESWETDKGSRVAIILPNGQPHLERYFLGSVTTAVVRVDHPYWIRRWELISESIFRYGFPAIFYDQIGSAYPSICYRDEPGAVRRPGTHAQRMRRFLKSQRSWIQASDPERAIITEDNAEPYLDLIDQHVLTAMPANNVPLFPAIYGDYTLLGGRAIDLYGETEVKGSQAFAMETAENLVYGMASGNLMSNELAIDNWLHREEARAEFEFLRRVVAVQKRFSDHLFLGTMLRPVRLETDGEIIRTKSQGWSKHYVAENPPVLTGTWQNTAGRQLIVFANYTSETRTITYEVPADSGYLGRNANWVYSQDGGTTFQAAEGFVASGALKDTREVPPRSVLVLLGTPQRTP